MQHRVLGQLRQTGAILQILQLGQSALHRLTIEHGIPYQCFLARQDEIFGHNCTPSVLGELYSIDSGQAVLSLVTIQTHNVPFNPKEKIDHD